MSAFLGLLVLLGCPGTGTVDQNAVKQSNARLDVAKDHIHHKRYDQAEIEAEKSLGHHKRNAEAHYVLGIVDLRRVVASKYLLEIEDCLTGVDAEALRSEQDSHLKSAEDHFVRAIELDREFGESWANRGVVATLLGDYDKAIEFLTRALELPSRLENIALVRVNLGWAYFHRGDHVSATRELLKANQFQPGMCVATYRLGRVYFARKEWQKAHKQFEDTAAKNCQIQDAHLFLMKTYVQLGVAQTQPEAFIKAETTCVAMAPRSCVAIQCQSTASGLSVPAAAPAPAASSPASSPGDSNARRSSGE